MLRHNVVTVAGHANAAEALKEAITERVEFHFDMVDIVRIREEMERLISNLAKCYKEYKATLHSDKYESVADEKPAAKDALPGSLTDKENDSNTLFHDKDSNAVDGVPPSLDERIKLVENDASVAESAWHGSSTGKDNDSDIVCSDEEPMEVDDVLPPLDERITLVEKVASVAESAWPGSSTRKDYDSDNLWRDVESMEVDDVQSPLDTRIKLEYNDGRTYI